MAKSSYKTNDSRSAGSIRRCVRVLSQLLSAQIERLALESTIIQFDRMVALHSSIPASVVSELRLRR